MDDEPIAKIIVTEFVKSAPLELAGLHSAIEINDREMLLKHIHRLNGAGGNVGAIRLHTLALDAEEAVYQNREINWKERLVLLEEAFSAFQNALAAWQAARPQE